MRQDWWMNPAPALRRLAACCIRSLWPQRDPRRGRPMLRIHIRTSPATPTPTR